MLNRTVSVPAHLGVKSSSFAFALGEVVEKTVNYVFDQKKPPTSPEDRKKIDGYMPNELRGELAYKVRPLNGVWATPPYLHNGSVPTVEASARPARRPAEDILSRQPRIRSRQSRLQVRQDRKRLRIRHLDSRQLEYRPRVQEGIQQGPGKSRA